MISSPISESENRHSPAPEDGRRSFLGKAAALIHGAVALALGIPVLRFVLHPVLRQSPADDVWAEVGNFSDLPVGEPQNRTFVLNERDGWSQRLVEKSVWIIRYPDDSARVFAAACPHLGCPVDWRADARNFRCLCHNSTFSFSGDRITGPAPRGLDALEYKVESGVLMVRHAPSAAATTAF